MLITQQKKGFEGWDGVTALLCSPAGWKGSTRATWWNHEDWCRTGATAGGHYRVVMQITPGGGATGWWQQGAGL